MLILECDSSFSNRINAVILRRTEVNAVNALSDFLIIIVTTQIDSSYSVLLYFG